MPRQSLDIRDFKYGVISSVDAEDIPIEAASDSLNVDGDVNEGILRGIPTDVELLIDSDKDGTIDDAIADIKQGEFIEHDGIYDLIYHDASANTISVITDFYDTYYATSGVHEKNKFNIISSLTSDNVTLTLQNQQVHVGIDGARGYWVGRVDHGLFGCGTSWAISDATNANPIVVTVNTKTISSVADYSGTVTGTVKITTSTAHGLITGNIIAISGTTDYNATFRVTVIDADEFYIPETYASSQTGTLVQCHSLKNGDIVKIKNVAGNTNANGIWVVSAVNNFTGEFTLTGAIGNSAYTSGGTVESYLTSQYSDCPTVEATIYGNNSFAATLFAENNATGYFQANICHTWGYSLTYDGIQESPLVYAGVDTTGNESDYYPISLDAYYALPYVSATLGLATFNKRVTAVNLYRADSIDNKQANIGLYRLVASVDINEVNWAKSNNNLRLTIWDYGTYYSTDAGVTTNPGNPVTYTENSGMPENLTDPTLYYALSTAGSGYHFVTKATQSDLAGSELRRVFKSKYLRYNMFDYYNDFLEMPEPVVAMQHYEGKLYIFSLNKVYRINIEGFYIEDVYEDAGAQGQYSVCTTEEGMFFANFNNAWMYREGNFYRIGDAIKQSSSSGRSWQTLTHNTLENIIVTSDAKKGYVLFINDYVVTGTTYNYMAWAYHPSKKRWDCFTFGGYVSSATGGSFKGKDGEVYLSNASKTYKLMRPETTAANKYFTQAWEWFSQDFSFGETRQKKSLTMIKTDATGTVAITYGVDGATPASSGTSEALINVYNKSIKVKLNANAVTSGTAYTNYVDSMELIYRPLIGTR